MYLIGVIKLCQDILEKRNFIFEAHKNFEHQSFPRFSIHVIFCLVYVYTATITPSHWTYNKIIAERNGIFDCHSLCNVSKLFGLIS